VPGLLDAVTRLRIVHVRTDRAANVAGGRRSRMPSAPGAHRAVCEHGRNGAEGIRALG
jgi:hypothetical protein